MVIRRFLHKSLVYINYLAVLAILIAYLSVYINPNDFSLFALFGLGYSFILVVNILFVFYWLYRKRKVVFISLIAILIGWPHFLSFFTINLSSTEKPNEKYHKILSYNVRLFDLYDWTKNKGIKDKIFYFLEDELPDIICFQEYYSKHKNNSQSTGFKIKEQLDIGNSHISFAKKGNREYNYGIATFSRFPIINRGIIEINDVNNSCIFTDIKIHHDTVRVYNVHLESVHFGYQDYKFIDSIEHNLKNEKIKGLFNITNKLDKAYRKRAQQVEIIYQHIRHSPYKVLVCGDFNDTPISYAYHRMTGELDDAFLNSGNGFGFTYFRKIFPFRIDYILCSPLIKTSVFETFSEDLSDHNPISTKFTLNPENKH